MGHDLLIAGMMMLVFDQPQPAPRPPPPMPRPALPMPMPAPVLRPSPMPDQARPRATTSRFVVCPADPRCRRHRRPIAAVPD